MVVVVGASVVAGGSVVLGAAEVVVVEVVVVADEVVEGACVDGVTLEDAGAVVTVLVELATAAVLESPFPHDAATKVNAATMDTILWSCDKLNMPISSKSPGHTPVVRSR